MKNCKITHNKRNKAAKMFLSGRQKIDICQRLEITESVFDEWIGCDDFKQFRRQTAFILFDEGVPDDKICNLLSISIERLDKWVKEGYTKKTNVQQIRNYKKAGRCLWVNEMCFKWGMLKIDSEITA